jgi:hypothetical protein
MRIITTILFFAAAILAQGADKLFDEDLATNAVAVLRVRRTGSASPLPMPDKYPYTRYGVEVYRVFKNESNENLGGSMSVNFIQREGGGAIGRMHDLHWAI